ncbi:thioredoxin domain-containing protein [Bifidobacterium asteroides]|uniref:DsbA family protein n=1 Tax=Bifidobacterium asteroides TaxID=1684 RepID=UPI001C6A2D30|nr:thioredoxin domain-containing protein [Bifidobacterium asteroides]QYN60450.1 thioredoxin domain-containing protein [Bifidobacterium asteroides]
MTKPLEQNGHEEPDQTGVDAVKATKPAVSATTAGTVKSPKAAEPVDGRMSTEEKPGKTGQSRESEPEERITARRSLRLSLILVAVALVLVLAAGIYMLWVDHSAGNLSAQKTSSGAPNAQVRNGPNGDAKAYKALQEVNAKPSVADDQGGLTVSARGVGSKKKVADAPTLEIFMDPMCPWCGKVGRVIDPQLQRMISAGQINVTYNFLNFLDSASSDQYSSRVDNALAMVAQEDPDHLPAFAAAVFAADFQPDESSYQAVSDARLADQAVGAGVPRSLADRFVQGTYRPWVDKVNAYAITRKDAKDTKGEFSTPTIMINGKVWDLTAAAKSQGGLEHLDRALLKALGLKSQDVGHQGRMPSIGAQGKALKAM